MAFLASVLATAAPPALAQSTVTFAAVGDYGDGSVDEGRVADLIDGFAPDFIVTTGDNSYGSNPIDVNIGQFYCDYIGAYIGAYCGGVGSATNRFFPSIGNHDVTDGGGLSAYLAYFTLPGAGIPTTGTSGNERYYDFVRGPVHFFVINSDTTEPDGRTSASTQAQWLQAQLAASTAPWKIVYMHHPPYSSALTHGSEADMQWPYEDWGASALFSGHDHTYERIIRDDNGDGTDFPYFVTGAGGRSLYSFPSSGFVEGSDARYSDDYGALIIVATETTLDFEFHSANPAHGVNGLIDSYSMTRESEDCESFETFTTGQTVGADPDWFDAGGGPVITAGIGVAGGNGLAPAGNIFIWTGRPFYWNDATFVGLTVQMDFETSASGVLDDDRVGFMTTDSSVNSDLIFGVQVDPSGGSDDGDPSGNTRLEGYWDHQINVDEDKRPYIDDLAGNLLPDTWYRLSATITRLDATSARVDASLTQLDANGDPVGAPVLEGTIADTAALGALAPDPAYFLDTLWPAYKNYTSAGAPADNACATVITSGCLIDDDCDDGDLCTVDVCSVGLCVFPPVVCDPGETCNPATGVCEAGPVAGDVIISSIQSWNDPGADSPGEFIELFNTTDHTISLENMQIISRVDNNSDGALEIDWQLAADLTGKSIAPHSFFLIAESGVDGEGAGVGVHDIETDMDLATGEGGVAERAISVELIVDGVHMDYVLYGRDDGQTPAGETPSGDIPFDGSSYPRAEVIRNTQGSSSFYEGLLRRESAEDLYAGYDVNGYYTDEDVLGDGYPNGVWTSPHDEENDAYEARNSTSAPVLPPGPACTSNADCDDSNVCTKDYCNTSGVCEYSNSNGPCDDGVDCTAGDSCVDGVCQGIDDCPSGEECDLQSGQCVPVQLLIAYNDLNPSTGDLNDTNVTEYDYNVVDGVLKDYITGNDTSITITGTIIGGYDPAHPTNGGQCNAGTDCGDIFGPDGAIIVDLANTIELDAAEWDNIITFNNLDPSRKYTITLTANRDNPDYAGARYAKVTIEGADTFTSDSSAGVVVNSEASVSFSIGYNTVNGYVARWTDVSAADGSFSVRSEWDNTQGSGSSNTKGYAMAAFKLEESIPACSTNADCNDGNVCTKDICEAGGTCAYIDSNGPCDDGIACTENDQCSAGVCAAGVPNDALCDDGIVCTDDVCAAGVGCTNTDNCPSGETCNLITGQCEAELCESFDAGYTLGQTIGSHADWFDGGNGPVVSAGIGVGGTVGLGAATNIFIWTAHPFTWGEEDFQGLDVQMDFQTDASGVLDDDRVGWMITSDNVSSDNIFGVQIDPEGGAIRLEGYWDGADGAADKRPVIDEIASLPANTWYRLRAEIEKIDDSRASIYASLTQLDASGDPVGAPVLEGTIADTSLLGSDTPHSKYFTAATMWPGFKNYTTAAAPADNACVDIVMTPSCTSNADCDDGNVCTKDICEAGGVCAYVNSSGPCDDGIACTENDQCAGGACAAGTPNDALCDDSIDCTDDVCAPATGCAYFDNCPEGESCNLSTGQCEAELCESFDAGYTVGQTIGSHPDWFDDGNGPVVTAGIGVSGTVGLGAATNIFIWTAYPFTWADAGFYGLDVQMDFQTDASGVLDDDRVGWMITNTSVNSDNIFGVQIDPEGGAIRLEGYWDGADGAADKRPVIDEIASLSPNTWYRLRAEIDKLDDSSAAIYASLTELDAAGDPVGAPVLEGTIADTSLLGSDTPHGKYFTAATMWPAFKNYTTAAAPADNACVDISALPPNQAPDQPTLINPADGAQGVPTDPELRVNVTDPEHDVMDVTFFGRATSGAAGENFTIIALPDTQFYAESYPANFSAQTQWIVDNREALNIAYVAHEGDIVDNAGVVAEWLIADAAMVILEDPVTTGLPDGIPYGVIPGNHDEPSTLYNQYFGVSRFTGRSYYGGSYSPTNNDDNYTLFSAGGMGFIVINFAYDDSPDANVLDWADALLKSYSDRRAIVVTHYLMEIGENASFGTQGAAIYNALRDDPNLFLMLCGHRHGEGMRIDTNSATSAPLYTLLADYQSLPNGGDGWLRIMEFRPAENKIHVVTYSPTLDQYGMDTVMAANSTAAPFDLAYDMGGGAAFEEIGTVTDVASGDDAFLNWPGLAAGQEYEWFVQVTDGGSTTTGPVWTFRTSCTLDEECDDGLFCTGEEVCDAGRCLPLGNPCTDPGQPYCDEELDACIEECHPLLYAEDFNSNAPGEDPVDWIDTGANNSLIEDDALFETFEVGGELAFGTASTATNIHSHYNAPGSHGWSSYEFTGRLMISSTTGGIGVTIMSDYPNSDTYYRLRRGNFPGGQAFHVDQHPDPTSTLVGTTDTGVVPVANAWYQFRFQVDNSGPQNAVRAKIWLDGTAEPPLWQVDAIDTNGLAATSGTFGVWSMGGGVKYWDDFLVLPIAGGGCDDADLCTVDVCSDTDCANVPVDCSAWSDACAVGSCNPATGACEAASANEGETCDDGDLCTTSDVCSLGICTGDPVICDDGAFCTGDESCDPGTGDCVSSGDPCDVTTWCDEIGDACVLYGDGDFDGDGDRDLWDFAVFQTCFGAGAYGDCEPANFSGDAMIDIDDYGEFATDMSGPG